MEVCMALHLQDILLTSRELIFAMAYNFVLKNYLQIVQNPEKKSYSMDYWNAFFPSLNQKTSFCENLPLLIYGF